MFYWQFSSLVHFWPSPIFNPGYAPMYSKSWELNNLGAKSTSCPGERRAVPSRINRAVSRTVQRAVDVADVHQRIQLLSLLWRQDVRLDAHRPTKLHRNIVREVLHLKIYS